MEPAGSGAKGGDCRDHARHRGVISEVRTKASAKGWGTFLSCSCPGASVPTELQIRDPEPCSLSC